MINEGNNLEDAYETFEGKRYNDIPTEYQGDFGGLYLILLKVSRNQGFIIRSSVTFKNKTTLRQAYIYCKGTTNQKFESSRDCPFRLLYVESDT